MTIAARLGLPFAVLGFFALAAGVTYPGDDEPPIVESYLPPEDTTAAHRLVRAYSDVEACLLEWNEREAGDAHLGLRIYVRPDGVVHADVYSGPEHHSMRYCVAWAFTRVKLPASDRALELDVAVHWMNQKVVISPRVRGEYSL